MKAIGYLIGACIAFTLLRAAAAALIAILVAAGVVALIVRPRESIGLAMILGIGSLVRDRPAALISIISILLAGALIAKAIDRLTQI